MNKIVKRIGDIGLVPVVVLENAEDALPTAKALLDGGIDLMEITMRTDAALDAIRLVAIKFPQMLLGAGTVLSTKMVDDAISAGAKFIVSPGLNPSVVKYCRKLGIPITPGCVTPTEIEQALDLDLDILKFFPAGMYGGVNGCKNLYGPYRMIKFIPTGGVNLSNLANYIDKPYIHAIGGSWLCTASAISKKNYDMITDTCRKSVNILIGFNIYSPNDHEIVPNIKRAAYHLKLAGYEDCGNDIYENKTLKKRVELIVK